VIAAALFIAIVLIQITVGFANYLHWTVTFAGQRRLPGFADMLAVYRQPAFFWMLPTFTAGPLLLYTPYASRLWGRILSVGLFAAPFLGSLVFLFLDDDGDERVDNLLTLWPLLLIAVTIISLAELRKGITLARLLPFFILAAIHGTFLSQQLWGSTYAIWPLLMVLIAYLFACLSKYSTSVVPAMASVVGVTFLVCGGLYAASHERLNYIQIPDGPVQHTTMPTLLGMSDRGPYLANFEELLRFTGAEIPTQDALLLLPGEDPFYYASGRVPRFPVLLFDRTTDPYSADELLNESRRHNVKWVIVKYRLQLDEDPLPDRGEVMALLAQDFSSYRQLAGYEIFRRK
jgi:hypothetical protein